MKSYCLKCNTPIWREYRHNGLAAVPVYYDPDVLRSAGPINPWRITHCSGCGEHLREEILGNAPVTAD